MKQTDDLEPAKSLIALLGGPKETAKITDNSENWVRRWPRRSDKGGNGGVVPGPALRKIVKHATEQRIEIPLELLVG